MVGVGCTGRQEPEETHRRVQPMLVAFVAFVTTVDFGLVSRLTQTSVAMVSHRIEKLLKRSRPSDWGSRIVLSQRSVSQLKYDLHVIWAPASANLSGLSADEPTAAVPGDIAAVNDASGRDVHTHVTPQEHWSNMWTRHTHATARYRRLLAVLSCRCRVRWEMCVTTTRRPCVPIAPPPFLY
jgi:hypothetical protein